MKKILFLVLCIFALSSCFFSDDKFSDEAKMTKHSGILSENQAKLANPSDPYISTHILTLDDESKISINCLAFNLSDPVYLGNKVQIIGVMDEENSIFQVTSITVLERITSYDYSKPKLTVYKSNKLGFELQYFNNWTFVEMDKKVIFSSPGEYGSLAELNKDEPSRLIVEQIDYLFEPSVFDTEENPDPLKSYVSLNFSNVQTIDDKRSKIGVDQLDSIKFSSDGATDYYVYRPDFIYKISFVNGTSRSTDFINDFNEMISKFRFIPISDVEVNNLPEDETEDIDQETVGDIHAGTDELNLVESNTYVEPTEKFSSFEATAFNFKAEYPAKWYYEAGNSTGSDSARHYSFSQKPLEESSELYGLDLFKGEIPKDNPVLINGVTLYKMVDGNNVSYFFEVNDKKFKVSGAKDYENFIIKSALSVQVIQ